jgi:hypothetical protein
LIHIIFQDGWPISTTSSHIGCNWANRCWEITISEWLFTKQAFKACSIPNAVTLVTSSSENTVNVCLRRGIDTQGLDDTQGVDASHVEQMVTFLKGWRHGVSAFALVINGQHDRFDARTQKLVKLINTFLNDRAFWDHVFIVFTKYYSGCDEIDKAVKQEKYRSLVLKLIRRCQGRQIGNPPPLPVFFVDSKRYDTDQDTREQYALLHGFVCGLPALPTRKVVVPNVTYLKVEMQTQRNILADVRTFGDTRIQTYENREREKRTGYDGHTITYSDWKVTRTWQNRQTRSSRTETRTVCVRENREPIFETEKYGGRRYGLCGPRKTRQVQCGEKVTRYMQEEAREVYTDFDGRISYSDWRVIRQWTY